MRGVVYDGNDYQVVDDLSVKDPDAGEVVVRIEAAGLCHSDLSVINGTIPFPTPVVLGHEGAGVVEAVGSVGDDGQGGRPRHPVDAGQLRRLPVLRLRQADDVPLDVRPAPAAVHLARRAGVRLRQRLGVLRAHGRQGEPVRADPEATCRWRRRRSSAAACSPASARCCSAREGAGGRDRRSSSASAASGSTSSRALALAGASHDHRGRHQPAEAGRSRSTFGATDFLESTEAVKDLAAERRRLRLRVRRPRRADPRGDRAARLGRHRVHARRAGLRRRGVVQRGVDVPRQVGSSAAATARRSRSATSAATSTSTSGPAQARRAGVGELPARRHEDGRPRHGGRRASPPAASSTL